MINEKFNVAKIIQAVIIIFIAKIFPPARLLLFLAFVFLHSKGLWIMAFSDPHDINYKRKTDKELYIFVLSSCIVAFFFALISFQIFIYVALLYWFYFIFFMLMFSRIWKFHGKKNIHLFLILILTTIISFVAAPFVRAAIPESFIYAILL